MEILRFLAMLVTKSIVLVFVLFFISVFYYDISFEISRFIIEHTYCKAFNRTTEVDIILSTKICSFFISGLGIMYILNIDMGKKQ